MTTILLSCLPFLIIGSIGLLVYVICKVDRVKEKPEVEAKVEEKPKSDLATTLRANTKEAKEAAKQEALDKLPEFFETLDKELLEYSEKNPTKTSFDLHPFIKKHRWENLLRYAGDEIRSYYRDFTFRVYYTDLSDYTKSCDYNDFAVRKAFASGYSRIELVWEEKKNED